MAVRKIVKLWGIGGKLEVGENRKSGFAALDGISKAQRTGTVASVGNLPTSSNPSLPARNQLPRSVGQQKREEAKRVL